ncbi:MAG: hypothetical protein HYU29_04035 [Chloroflexi bacterium]|nr:hypothetical protein [Chloroflexota bacterium]
MSQLVARAGVKPPAFPQSNADLAGFIKAFLDLERVAITMHHSLAEKTRHTDVVTHEVAEEDELETLLGE